MIFEAAADRQECRTASPHERLGGYDAIAAATNEPGRTAA